MPVRQQAGLLAVPAQPAGGAAAESSVLPGGRGHRQITQNRPYKKIICGEKLMAVKVAVSGNKVL